MSDLNGFDANEVEPAGEFGLLPDGEYLVAIVESETKATKKNDGEYLEIKMQVIDGEFEKRNIWERLNIKNKSQQCQQIAYGKLSSICRAVGVMKPLDSAELHDLPFKIKIATKKNKSSGEMENVINAFKPKTESTQATPASPSGGGEKKPWEK